MTKTAATMLAFTLFFSACASAPETPLERRLDRDQRRIAAIHWNPARGDEVAAILAEAGVATRRERPVPLGAQRNVITGPDAPLCMIVAHFDVTDALGVPSPPSLPTLSSGAIDNAGSLAVLIELARRGYATLATGYEETGLSLGSRYHERRPRTVIVLELVGAGGHAVDSGSDDVLFNALFQFSQIQSIELSRVIQPPIGGTELSTWKRRGQALGFTARMPLAFVDLAAAVVGLPLSRRHGVLDRPGLVSPARMAEAVVLLDRLLGYLTRADDRYSPGVTWGGERLTR